MGISILGLQAYLDWFPGDRAIQGVRNALANRLLDIYERTHSETWKWFEKSLSYSNARLSQALILAGWRSDNQRMIEAGMDSLKWLVAEQHRDDREIFVPIGSSGFFIEGNEKARFDQQPVEACATISACLEVYRLTEERQWREEAQRVFCWFLGKNDLRRPAGIAAALAAADLGARVMLCDEQTEFGGSLLGDGAARIDGADAPLWVQQSLATLQKNPRVTLLARTTAFGYFPHNFVGLHERLTDHLAVPPAHQPRERLWQVRARLWCSPPAPSNGRWCFRATIGRASCSPAPRKPI